MTPDPRLIQATRAAFEDLLDESPLAPDWERVTGQIVPLRSSERRPYRTYLFGVAAAAAVVVIAGSLLMLRGDGRFDIADESTLTTVSEAAVATTTVAPATTTAAEPFDFATQSLCDWFTPEQIDAIVTSTYAELGVPLDPDLEMDQVEGQNSDCAWAWPVVTLSERHEPVDWAGTTFAQHPALGDSVVVSIHEPGSYGLMHGIDALLKVDGHPEPMWFGHTTPESVSGDVETINTLGLTIANEMLKGMGWIE